MAPIQWSKVRRFLRHLVRRDVLIVLGTVVTLLQRRAVVKRTAKEPWLESLGRVVAFGVLTFLTQHLRRRLIQGGAPTERPGV